MNLLSLTMAICAALVAYWFGHSAGVAAERERVLAGIHLALYRLTSPLLGTLYRWVREELTMDEAKAEFDEYAAAKKAKHEAEQHALLERLTRRGEKE
jgi:hypothetical protein